MNHRINIKKAADCDQTQYTDIQLSERLPAHVISSDVIQCSYRVEKKSDYYLLTLHTSGKLMVCCQRCLGTFEYQYDNDSMLAFCRSEAQAEQLMQEYDSMVLSDNIIDLIDIVTDELYLYVPEKHDHVAECDRMRDSSRDDDQSA